MAGKDIIAAYGIEENKIHVGRAMYMGHPMYGSPGTYDISDKRIHQHELEFDKSSDEHKIVFPKNPAISRPEAYAMQFHKFSLEISVTEGVLTGTEARSHRMSLIGPQLVKERREYSLRNIEKISADKDSRVMAKGYVLNGIEEAYEIGLSKDGVPQKLVNAFTEFRHFVDTSNSYTIQFFHAGEHTVRFRYNLLLADTPLFYPLSATNIKHLQGPKARLHAMHLHKNMRTVYQYLEKKLTSAHSTKSTSELGVSLLEGGVVTNGSLIHQMFQSLSSIKKLDDSMPDSLSRPISDKEDLDKYLLIPEIVDDVTKFVGFKDAHAPQTMISS